MLVTMISTVVASVSLSEPSVCDQYKTRTAQEVSAATIDAEVRLTRLFVSKGWPLMCTTSGPGLLVTFCVCLLKPVNWTVAPRTESSNDPSNPAAAPALSRTSES